MIYDIMKSLWRTFYTQNPTISAIFYPFMGNQESSSKWTYTTLKILSKNSHNKIVFCFKILTCYKDLPLLQLLLKKHSTGSLQFSNQPFYQSKINFILLFQSGFVALESSLTMCFWHSFDIFVSLKCMYISKLLVYQQLQIYLCIFVSSFYLYNTNLISLDKKKHFHIVEVNTTENIPFFLSG